MPLEKPEKDKPDRSDLLQGTLDMLILKIVALGPVHGYGISLRIRQVSRDVLQVQQGSLYPALHRLEKRGWLRAEWGESENGREAQVLPALRQRPETALRRGGKLAPPLRSDRAGARSRPLGVTPYRWFSSTPRNRDRDLDREVAFHIDALARDYEAAGMSPTKPAARRASTSAAASRSPSRSAKSTSPPSREAIRLNARAAFRFLRKAPGLSAAVILTLALGIGANTAVFSAIDAVILRPLAFPQGDQLMTIEQYDTKGKSPVTFVAPTRLEDWNRLNHTFQALTGYDSENRSETSGPLPEYLDNAIVAPRFFDVWGVAPELGRGFTPAEEHYGGPNVVLITHRLWMNRYHGDPNVIGKQLHFGPEADTIVGVMPAAFAFPDHDVNVFMPSPPDAPYAQDRASTWYTVVGRLKPGVTRQQALADLSAVQRQLGQQFPRTDRDLGVRVQPLKSEIIGNIGSSLWLLYGAVILLLLIACTNIARSADCPHRRSQP